MTVRGLVVAVALAAAPTAASADTKADARALSDEGRRYHDAGDYDRAIIAFRRAYELAPSPALLFNLGQSYRLKGACDDAVIMYRSYLKTEPPAEHRKLTEAHLASVEQCTQTKVGLRPAAAS